MFTRMFVFFVAIFTAWAVFAEQRMETRDGFCHFVVSPDNDDYETFRGVCENSITPDDNAVAAGYAHVTATYSVFTAPLIETTVYTPETAPGVCVMVDSNGVNYVSNNWAAQYVVTMDQQAITDFFDAYLTNEARWDYNMDGIVDSGDGILFQMVEPVVTIEYRLSCLDGAAQ